MGKTTLAALAPKPVFLGLDRGAERIKHPVTNECLEGVTNLATFQDVLDILDDPANFEGYETIVIDTITMLQDWARDHVVATIPTDKGKFVKNILGYGWGNGFQHLYDTMDTVLTKLDKLSTAGYNIILIAQSNVDRVPNPSGDDFLRDGVRLQTGKYPIQNLFCEWADHVLRIAYLNMFTGEGGKATGSTGRAIYTQPEVYFQAKTRWLPDPVVSFEDKEDKAIWDFMFGGD